MNIGGIEYEEDDLELFPDGAVHDATLVCDTMIQGLSCVGGQCVVFYPSGRLKIAWLSTANTISGIPCAAGLIVFLYENGQVMNASLADPHRINNRLFSAGTRVTFDESGELLEYEERLERDTLLDGLPCAADLPIWRYANGRLSLVVLSESCEVGGQSYSRGAELYFDESGKVIRSNTVDLDSGQKYMHRVFGVYEGPID